MAPPGNNKWTDAAVKDLTFAILMSHGDGNFNINANWDNVLITMESWGYGFTKSAMSQHWSKRILKEFKERHAEGGNNNGNGSGSGSTTTSTPHGKGRASAAGTPKTSGSGTGNGKGKGAGKGKGKRAAAEVDDDDENNDTPPEHTNSTVDPIARSKSARSNTSTKKVKYEESPDLDDEGEPIEEGGYYQSRHASGPAAYYGEPDDAFEGI